MGFKAEVPDAGTHAAEDCGDMPFLDMRSTAVGIVCCKHEDQLYRQRQNMERTSPIDERYSTVELDAPVGLAKKEPMASNHDTALARSHKERFREPAIAGDFMFGDIPEI